MIVPAMDRDRERPFNVYLKDTQHTREVARRETEHLFQLEKGSVTAHLSSPGKLPSARGTSRWTRTGIPHLEGVS